jgi:uncharacterized protein (DUF433 family)
MDWRKHIVSNEKVLLGKPAIKGTRISVDHIISLLAQGWTEQKILENFPRLTKEDLQAVFAFLYECFQDGLFINPVKKSA